MLFGVVLWLLLGKLSRSSKLAVTYFFSLSRLLYVRSYPIADLIAGYRLYSVHIYVSFSMAIKLPLSYLSVIKPIHVRMRVHASIFFFFLYFSSSSLDGDGGRRGTMR